MIEHGVVVNTDGRIATVEVCDLDAESCRSCTAACGSKKGKSWQVEASGGLRVGSRVTLEVKMPSTYTAIALLLVIPLVLLLAGIAAGKALFGSNLAAFGLGVALLIASYGGARAFESWARRKGHYRPVVTEVFPPVGADRE